MELNLPEAPADATPPPAEFVRTVRRLDEGLREILGSRLESFFLYGAVVFRRPPDWRLDVDFHAFLGRPPTSAEKDAIRGLHARLEREEPSGDDMDGYYVLASDARRSERPRCVLGGARDDAWALHRAHFRAGRLALLTGVHPCEVVPDPEWEEILADLRAAHDYAATVPEYPEFGILNGCRIIRSVRTREVVYSKADSAEWGRAKLPGWRDAIDAAVRRYTGRPAEGDSEVLRDAFPRFGALVRAEIGR